MSVTCYGIDGPISKVWSVECFNYQVSVAAGYVTFFSSFFFILFFRMDVDEEDGEGPSKFSR